MRSKVIYILPTANIIFMELIDILEMTLLWQNSDGSNWIIQILFIVADLILLMIHYAISYLLPRILTKINNGLDLTTGFQAIISVFIANLLMLFLGIVSLGTICFPRYIMMPIFVSTIIVICTSIYYIKR